MSNVTKAEIKVPQSIKIGAHSFTVRFDPQIDADHDRGVVHFNYGSIFINPEWKEKSTREVAFWHEILHIIDRTYNRNEITSDDEKNIWALGEGLAQVMQELGINLDWSEIKERL